MELAFPDIELARTLSLPCGAPWIQGQATGRNARWASEPEWSGSRRVPEWASPPFVWQEPMPPRLLRGHSARDGQPVATESRADILHACAHLRGPGLLV